MTNSEPSSLPKNSYWLSRFLFLRLLGFVCVATFFSLITQLGPLLGKEGILPAYKYLQQVQSAAQTLSPPWLELPTIFWINCSDTFLYFMAFIGLILSLLLLLGISNGMMLAIIWIIYLSFIHVGQIFYGYGWEILLLETCFLSVFFVPFLDPRPLSPSPPPRAIIWFYRWLVFRVMLGAGLIKLRGDPCWRDLTCLFYHFETQPIPNPISWYLHQLPPLILKLGVLWNHFIELIAPFLLIGPQFSRTIGSLLIIGFQIFLIVSGNLSFLNWITIAICIPLLDDQFLQKFVPRRLMVRMVECIEKNQRMGRAWRITMGLLTVIILLLSIQPTLNILSSGQIMNTSFDPLHLVNTYGAFGSVGKTRYEIILEGTQDIALTADTKWKEYEFWAKPGDVHRRPPFIAPYQPRLDWQIWFAAMSSIEREPWLVHLIYKLLQNDRSALHLLANNPFPDRPPHFIQAELYEYHFTRIGDHSGAWWKRQRVGSYLRPVTLNDPRLKNYLHAIDLE